MFGHIFCIRWRLVFTGIYRKHSYLVHVSGFHSFKIKNEYLCISSYHVSLSYNKIRMTFITLNKSTLFWIKLHKVFGKLLLHFDSNLKYLFTDIIFCSVLERILNSIYDNIKSIDLILHRYIKNSHRLKILFWFVYCIWYPLKFSMWVFFHLICDYRHLKNAYLSL